MKNNREMLKEMSFKEKASYVWEYYKFHILVVIVAIVITLDIIMAPDIPSYGTNILALGQIFTIDERYDQYVASLKETQNANIEVFYGDWSNEDQYVMEHNMMFILRLQSQEADLFLLNPIKYEQLQVFEDDEAVFLALDTVPQLQGLLDNYSEDLLVKGIDPATGQSHVYGLLLLDDSMHSMTGLSIREPIILCINPYAKDLDHTIATVQYIL
ncbi:MAG: hypothetical protein BEN18_07170 [Epulopiscium sp. Nuni2H_MBin001]|nr:MAG: hypothetical protein BEN18_07170 [Epulopiscium sp. Nuni2H_MBin001]